MIFTVLNYKTLDPLMVLDDYISAIWNNKYFTAGDFEIKCRTTNERILKLVRNNFITLNGTDEIAVIESVEFTKDEEQGVVMTITGAFAQALLGKRVIWDKTLLNGTVETELQRLIEENAVSPHDPIRSLDCEIEYKTISGRVLNVPEGATRVFDLEIVSDTAYKSEGTPKTYIDYGRTGKAQETGLMQGVEIVTTEPIVTETKKDGTTRTLQVWPQSWAEGYIPKYYSVNTDIVANTSFKNNAKTTHVKNTSFYNLLNATYRLDGRNLNELNDELKGNLRWDWYDTGYQDEAAKSWIKIELQVKVDAPDHVPMSSYMRCLTKAEYNAGMCGVACFDNNIWIRAVLQGAWAHEVILSADMYDSIPFAMVYVGIIGRVSLRNEGLFYENGADDELIYKSNELTSEPQSWQLYGSNLDQLIYPEERGVSSFELKQVDARLNHSLYAVCEMSGYAFFDYLRTGRMEGIEEQLILQVIGDNLQAKVEEILQLYGLGMRARYEAAERKIYFDFYKGYNRTKDSLLPVIYSESLDNLAGYDVVSKNEAANVALVYSEKDGETFSGTAGAAAGVARRETYINKTDDVGYIGADYVQQLQEEGKLSLQSFTLAISADVDNRAYDYRRQFNVGDIVTLIINDLQISYNVRVLEVREYNDVSGYTIEMILGE